MSKSLTRVASVFCFTFFFLAATIAYSGTPGFIPNKGQWNGNFTFKTELNNLTVFTETDGFKYVLSEPIVHDHDHDHNGDYHPMPDVINRHAFSMRFVNSSEINYNGVSQKSGHHNYFLGNDPDKWKSNVPVYEELNAADIYEGVDLRIYSEKSQFKYDFIVKAGADHQAITFNYTGADEIIFSSNKLVIRTSVGELVESIPESYQIIDGVKTQVYCEYIETSDGIGFAFPFGYDTDVPLVIDPILLAATLSGTSGSANNFGHGAAFDLAGNIYTHAISFNSGYPTDEGSFQEIYGGGGTDAVVSKLTPDGTDLVFATFIGGSGGEYPHSTIVNANEEIYVYGITSSSDFPVDINAYQSEYGGGGDDIFITALSADGSELVGSTYLGGSGTDGRNQVGFGYDNYRGEINLNLAGEVFLASSSSSENFPVTAGAFQEEKSGGQDAVIVKLNDDLSDLIWSSFHGSEVDDMAYGIRVKDDGSVYVCGAVGGSSSGGNGDGFTTTDNAFQTEFSGGQNDGYVTQISEDGSGILNSTFLGESSNDKAYFLDFDNDDNVWVYMESASTWDITEGVWGTEQGGIMVHKLSENLDELLVSSYLSDNSSASGTPVAFMVDLCNNVYISAYGASGFQATQDALFTNGGFYVGVFAPDMSDLIFGTYYTGTHVDGGTSRFDKQGIIYQGVCSGGGFNTTDDAWATSQTTGWDIGVFKIDLEIESVNAVAGAAGQLTGCAPHTVNFQNYSSGETFEWDFGNGTTSDEFQPSLVYDEPGDYLVSLVVYDPESCNVRDTAYIPITVLPEVEFFTDFSWSLDCENGTIEITDASQGPADIEYQWDMGDGTLLSDTNPSYTYAEPGEYTVTLTLESEACNQIMTEEQTVIYVPFIEAEFNAQVIDICDSYTISISNQSSGGVDFFWDMGDGNTLEESENVWNYTYDDPGLYTLELIIANEESCNFADTVEVDVEIVAPPVLDPEIDVTQQGLCSELSFFATVDPNGPAGSFEWILNEDTIGTQGSINSSVSDPGVYTLVVVVTDPVCDVPYTTTTEFEMVETLGYEIPPFVTLCYHDPDLLLDATVPYDDATYNWNNGLSTESSIVVDGEGTFDVDVVANGCEESQSSTVNYGPEFPLAFEDLICEGQPNTILFQDELGVVESVSWENGQNGLSVEVSESGYYPFTAIDILGCTQVDSLLAIPRDDDPNLEIPNVFTPNGDGRNDFFQIQGDTIVGFELIIFDRWGRQVFETDEIYGNWDGTYTSGSGEAGGEDTFMYILKYRDYCDRSFQTLTGDVKVLR